MVDIALLNLVKKKKNEFRHGIHISKFSENLRLCEIIDHQNAKVVTR